MSKITKKQLHNGWYCHDTEIIKMKKELRELKQSVLRLEKLTDEKLLDEPQLKQLDQSVFDGLDEKWRFAAVDRGGLLKAFTYKPKLSVSMTSFILLIGNTIDIGGGYDASNWQNSLIERDIAKELLEVGLSSELTGSDYYYSKSVTERLENGQKLIMCFVSNVSESDAIQERHVEVITSVDTEFKDTDGYGWQYAVPINNQGKPLTQAEAGL